MIREQAAARELESTEGEATIWRISYEKRANKRPRIGWRGTANAIELKLNTPSSALPSLCLANWRISMIYLYFSSVRVLFILCSREREARCFCYNRVAGCRGSIRSSLLLCLYSKVLARGEHFQISYWDLSLAQLNKKNYTRRKRRKKKNREIPRLHQRREPSHGPT